MEAFRRKMEFGSDYHAVSGFHKSGKSELIRSIGEGWLMADGRQCLISLIRQQGWKRLWVPEYFCYQVLKSLVSSVQIELLFYPDNPKVSNDTEIVMNLPYRKGDALLRMNYFGTRGFRSSKEIEIPVVEDHSHDITGEWAVNSNAQWCIASLRKLLPIASGGLLWSPVGERLKLQLQHNEDFEAEMELRWRAMDMKAEYLGGGDICKEEFRRLLIESEGKFDDLITPCGIDNRSKEFINKIDIEIWQKARQENWLQLYSELKEKTEILLPEKNNCNIFSLIILAHTAEHRERIRKALIERNVYPAILWDLPQRASKESADISNRMLSVHCDGRYNNQDISALARIIKQALC